MSAYPRRRWGSRARREHSLPLGPGGSIPRLRCPLLLLLLSSPALATWSIVASDSASGQLGGAGTSCVGSLDVSILFAAAPGAGAIHAQALVNVDGRDRGAELLGLGATPDDVIAAITEPSFDGNARFRQYGAVDLFGGAAGYTGSANGDWAGDRQGTDGTFTWSAQGNILTGAPVVQRTEGGFVAPGACDLAERLMVAIEAGAAPGEGDSRCTPSGLPSDSAFLRVIDGSGASIVDLSVTDTSPDDPLDELRARFDAWRETHPCPLPPPETSSTTPTDSGSPTDAGPTAPEGTPPADGDEPPPAADPATEASGCGCDGSGGAAGGLLLVLAVASLRSTSARERRSESARTPAAVRQ